jgi:hypothetical protein
MFYLSATINSTHISIWYQFDITQKFGYQRYPRVFYICFVSRYIIKDSALWQSGHVLFIHGQIVNCPYLFSNISISPPYGVFFFITQLIWYVSLIFAVDHSLTWTGYWFWLRIFPFTWIVVLILTADISVFLIWTHWFWLLTFYVWYWFHGGCKRSAGDASPPRHLIPPQIYSEVRVRQFSDLYSL